MKLRSFHTRYLSPEIGAEEGQAAGDLPEEEQENAEEEGQEEEVQASGEEEAPAEEEQSEEDGLTVTIAGEESEQEEDDLADMTPKARKRWAEMRIQLREEKRARRELEQKLTTPPEQKQIQDPGPEPTIGDPDVDYDGEKFAAKYKEWVNKKAEADRVVQKQREAQEKEQAEWSSRLESYTKAKTKLRAPDFDDSEEAIKSTLSVVQQGIILKGAEDPAKVVYALGRSPKHLATLAAIKDPVEFACAMAKLETRMTVVNKKTPPPPPEKPLRSQVTGAAAVDNQLERLREEARKTGNYDKVGEYQRQLRAKSLKQA